MKILIKKPTGKTLENAREIAAKGGAIASSDWTRGTGNFVSKRPIPAGCIEILASEVFILNSRSKKAAVKLLKDRPRVTKIIAVSNWKLIA